MAVDLTNFGTAYSNNFQGRIFANYESFAQNSAGLALTSYTNLDVSVGTTYAIGVTGNYKLGVSGDSYFQTTNNVEKIFGDNTTTVSGKYSNAVTGALVLTTGSTGHFISQGAMKLGTTGEGAGLNLSAAGDLALSGINSTLTATGTSTETITGNKTITSNQYSLTASSNMALLGNNWTVGCSGTYNETVAGAATITYGSNLTMTAATATLTTNTGAITLTSTGGDVQVTALNNLQLECTTDANVINLGNNTHNSAVNIGTGGVRKVTLGTTTGTSDEAFLVNCHSTFAKDVYVNGNLNVKGTTQTINTEQFNVVDKMLVLNDINGTTDIAATAGGIVLQGATNHELFWYAANQATGLTPATTTSGSTWMTNDSHFNVPTTYSYQINNKVALTEQKLAVDTTQANGGLYLAGPTSVTEPSAGEWRIRQDNSGATPVLIFQRYDNINGSNVWNTRFRMQ